MNINEAISLTRNPSLWLLLFFLMAPFNVAWSQDAQQATEPENSTEYATLDQTIEAITERRKALENERTEINRRLQKASDQDSELLQKQLALLEQTAATFTAQIIELNRSQELDAQKTADLQEIARLEKEPEPEKPFSVLDLDRAREQLAIESARVKVVRAKVDFAKEGLAQTQLAFKQTQDKLTQIQNQNGAIEPLLLKAAELEHALAEQQQTLRELELKNEEKTFSVYDTHLDLLRRQNDYLQQHAGFNSSELTQKNESIRKHQFELNRDLSRLNDQQSKAQSLLDQARKRLEAASFEDIHAIEETEARRLELEALKSKTDAAQRELKLISERKEIWQKRHDLFNESVEQQELPNWRSHSNSAITQIEQEQATIKLWLSDWQSRLNAVGSKTIPDKPIWESRQSEHIQSIIGTLTELNGAMDESRRLHQYLIEDINARTSQYNLSDRIKSLINMEINHNSLLDWFYAFAIASVTFILLFVLRWFLIRGLRHAAERKHFSQANEILSTVKRANLIFFLVVAVFFASLSLTLDPATDTTIAKITKVVIALQIAIWLSGFIRAWIFRILSRKTKRDGASMGALAILNFISQVLLWAVALLLILQNIGIDITALVAGLGIGGIAIALALQRILSDLFASLSIVLDKPFVIGDFVNFGDFFGTIEHIGVKTTRLRSLTGEQIICANGELLDTRIRNYKRMQERRVVFKLGVVYDTPYEKLQAIPAMLKAIVEKRDKTRFDRAHFFQYGEFSLDFEIVYYVLSPDYGVYMDAQQAINLDIYQQFQQEGIEFAYPTQSLYVHNKTVSEPKLSEIG
ncbi:mechanosensitive ion channel domain-containing protein [Methylotuvimicrobium buryatense]|uniref:Mechanosensitive ion channel n=1 Tax=Methylotuvimicrobium buryatense TaxID=95641 RepID=A0A4P9UP24_METBY|nr:mechanosensitive ion channel domain-containing protein [Methylotuvimicrobium buryatense]QCW83124.1 mechanosensitive ion channel [Methylotuvimicrobium buryatense]